MLQALARVEGPVVAAANEPALRAADGLAIPDGLFAAGAAPRALPLGARARALGFAAVEFASGARAVLLARAPRMASPVRARPSACPISTG